MDPISFLFYAGTLFIAIYLGWRFLLALIVFVIGFLFH